MACYDILVEFVVAKVTIRFDARTHKIAQIDGSNLGFYRFPPFSLISCVNSELTGMVERMSSCRFWWRGSVVSALLVIETRIPLRIV